MSMSTRVTGLRSEETEIYKKHANVLIACLDAGIKKLPEETAKFFKSEYPDKYLLEEILEVKLKCYDYNEDMTSGIEVIVSEIPEGVYKIRFSNSW